MLLFFTGLAGLTGNPAAPGRADAAPVSAVLIGTRIRAGSTHTWAAVCRCKRASSRLGFWPRCDLVSSVGRRMPRLDFSRTNPRPRGRESLGATTDSVLELVAFSGTERKYGPRPFVLPHQLGKTASSYPRLSTWTPLTKHLSLIRPSIYCRHVHQPLNQSKGWQRSIPFDGTHATIPALISTGRKHQPVRRTNGRAHQTATRNGNTPNNTTSRKPDPPNSPTPAPIRQQPLSVSAYASRIRGRAGGWLPSF